MTLGARTAVASIVPHLDLQLWSSEIELEIKNHEVWSYQNQENQPKMSEVQKQSGLCRRIIQQQAFPGESCKILQNSNISL